MEETGTGIIYKLYNQDSIDKDFYIGSTFLTIEQRLKQHVRDYNRYLNNKHHYVTSFDIL